MNKSEQKRNERVAGPDFSLVRENLRLSPKERLEQLERVANDLNALRAAMIARQAAATAESSPPADARR